MTTTCSPFPRIKLCASKSLAYAGRAMAKTKKSTSRIARDPPRDIGVIMSPPRAASEPAEPARLLLPAFKSRYRRVRRRGRRRTARPRDRLRDTNARLLLARIERLVGGRRRRPRPEQKLVDQAAIEGHAFGRIGIDGSADIRGRVRRARLAQQILLARAHILAWRDRRRLARAVAGAEDGLARLIGGSGLLRPIAHARRPQRVVGRDRQRGVRDNLKF